MSNGIMCRTDINFLNLLKNIQKERLKIDRMKKKGKISLTDLTYLIYLVIANKPFIIDELLTRTNF